MRTVYKLRGWLMVPPMLFAVLCTWAEVENELLVFGVGGGTFLLGVLIRIWAQMHLHYRLKMSMALTTTGPYAFVRNPIYIANTTIMAGACMLAELFWFVPLQIIYCAVVYSFVVRYEGAYLTDRYGAEYLAYADRVPKWFPLFKRSGVKRPSVKQYLFPSIFVETYNVVYLLPYLIKEVIAH